MTTIDDTDRTGGGAAAPSGTGAGLRPPLHRVEPVAVRWWTVRAVLTAAPPVAALGVATALVPPGARVTAVVLLAVAVVLAGAYVTAMPRVRYRVHRYEVNDEAVYTTSGWLWQEARLAPLSRVQTVDVARGPLQRAFGLAGLTVTTASAIGPVRVVGLAESTAEEIAAHLAGRTQAVPGDAT